MRLAAEGKGLSERGVRGVRRGAKGIFAEDAKELQRGEKAQKGRF